MFLKLISFVTFLGSVSQGANILAILPTPSYSHQIAYTQLWKELSLRGHKVTVITTDPLKDPSLTNLTEIDMTSSYQYFSDISTVVENTMTMWNAYDIFREIILKIAEAQFTYAPVQDLIRNGTTFDVVLVEFIYPELLAYAEIYNCPKIAISSMDANAYFYGALGNPLHPILYPDMVTPFYGSLSFKERVTATLFSWHLANFFASKMIPQKQNLIQRYLNITSSVEEIVRDVDLMFVNVNPVIHGSRAIGPTTINIGDIRRPVSPKPLPVDLKDFLDGATNGFIYFSLGSNVKSRELNEETFKSIIETLRELPYKVLWKFEADDLPGKPNNVKIVKWTPQQNVLSHPNIKLFIMQGGLQSMEEAIFSEVPLVVIPFFADQEQNAKLAETKGIGKRVERQPFVKKSDLKEAIQEVLDDPSYKNAVKRLKILALDTPMTGLEKAIWWTEYVIRNKGAKHLRNPAADLPTYQYYLIDVISFLALVTILVLAALVFLARILYKTVVHVFKHNQKFIKEKKVK